MRGGHFMGSFYNSKTSIILWLLPTFVLVSLFQNCTGANFGGSQPIEYQATGDGHEGKLSIPIDYVRSQNTFYNGDGFPLDETFLQQALQNKPSILKFCRSLNQDQNEGVDLVVAKESSLWPSPVEVHDMETSLPAQSTMTRFSQATGWNNSGLMRVYNNHEPRFQINPKTGQEGLLVESYSKNLVSDSMDFTAASWMPTGLNVGLHATLNDPMNLGRTTLLSENTTANVERSIGTILWLTSSKDVSLSVYTKASTPGRHLSLRMRNLQGDEFRCIFDPVNESIVAQSSSNEAFDCRFKKYPNGWLRPSLTFNAGSLPSNTSTAYLELVDAQQGPIYVPTGHPGIVLWGAQFEEQADPTSFIPTVGFGLERQQEFLRLRQGMPNKVDSKWSIDYFTNSGSTLRIDLRDVPFSTDYVSLENGKIEFNFDGTSSFQQNVNFTGDQLTLFEFSNGKITAFNGGELAGHRNLGRNQSLGSFEISLDRGQSYIKKLEIFDSESSEELLSIQSLKSLTAGTQMAVIALGRNNNLPERVQTQPFAIQQESNDVLESNIHDFSLVDDGIQTLLKASLDDGTFIEEPMNCN